MGVHEEVTSKVQRRFRSCSYAEVSRILTSHPQEGRSFGLMPDTTDRGCMHGPTVSVLHLSSMQKETTCMCVCSMIGRCRRQG